MSLLQKFFILFDSDASEVKKGAAEAEEVTNNLNKKLNATEVIGNKLGSSFKNLIKQASGAVLGILSVGAIVAGTRAAASYANNLDDLSKALQTNVEDLSIWGDVVSKKGGTVEGFQSTITTMTASLVDFAVKGTSRVSPFFQELNIRMTDARGKARSFLEILPELADRFEKIGKKESFGIGQKLGLDQGTIMALQAGRREIEALVARQKELGIITKKDADIAAAFNNQWGDTRHIFRSLFVTINSVILPVLTDLLVRFEKVSFFVKSHSHLIVGSLTAIGTVISYFLIPAITKMLIVAAPFILIGAAITAIGAAVALLYDDLMNFYEGNQSVIGELVKKWPVLGEILKFIGHLANQLVQIFLSIPNAIKWAWEGITSIVKLTIDNFMSNLNIILKAYEKIKSFITGIPSKVEANIITGKDFLNLANSTPISAQTSNSILSTSMANSKSVDVQTGPITINTQATDAEGISEALSNSLENQIRQAINNFDDGVLA